MRINWVYESHLVGLKSPQIKDTTRSTKNSPLLYNVLCYIFNKEIQEFLVKIKILFLRSLEIFISSREINLCRLDNGHLPYNGLK